MIDEDLAACGFRQMFLEHVRSVECVEIQTYDQVRSSYDLACAEWTPVICEKVFFRNLSVNKE